MPVATMNFDWLLEHAASIAFDPGRSSMYVFGLEMSAEELRAQVLEPMAQQDLFAVAQTKFIEAAQRERYKGQLPRVGLSLFEVGGRQCGIVLSYHSKFEPDLAQYDAWQTFWNQRLLDAARAQATA